MISKQNSGARALGGTHEEPTDVSPTLGADQLFDSPRHPYTRMLLDAVPDLEMTGATRTAVAGEVPNPLDPPAGCHFHPRCPQAMDVCRQRYPEGTGVSATHTVNCHLIG